MLLKSHSLILLTCAFLMTACGSGGDSSGSSDPMLNPSTYTVEELRSHVNDLIDSRYDGNRETAQINLETVQAVYQGVGGGSPYSPPSIAIDPFSIEKYIGAPGKFDVSLGCEFGGRAIYTGELDQHGYGNLSVKLESCQYLYREYPLSGIAVIQLRAGAGRNPYVVFYDNVTWQTGAEEQISLTGYMHNSLSLSFSDDGQEGFAPTDYKLPLTSTYKLLFTSDQGTQFIHEASISYKETFGEKSYECLGSYYDKELGKISFKKFLDPSSEDYYGVELWRTLDERYWNSLSALFPTSDSAFDFGYEFNGDIKAQLFVSDYYVKYLEDLDSDNEFEQGIYLGSRSELVHGELNAVELVAFENLYLPPQAGAPTIQNGERDFFTADSIIAEPGYMRAPDTDNAYLSYSFKWYINGELVEGNTSNSLPPFTAVSGDTVEVGMVVYDGVSNIESSHSSITIQDTPAQLIVSDFPSSISVGERFQFTITVDDPDLVSSEVVAATLISGPEGATISKLGLVEWVPEDNLFFSSQEFEFILAANRAAKETFKATVTVHSDREFPLARSSSFLSKAWAADFNGDGKSELLSANYGGQPFLMEEYNGQYLQSWVYPYALPNASNIVQVLPMQYDDDAEMEILVATAKSISVIRGLSQTVQPLLETKAQIIEFEVADLDLDGEPELIYLLGSSSSYSLTVAEFRNPQNQLFTTTVPSSTRFTIGNTDNDPQLELILAAGLILDGSTYAIEWSHDTPFGDTVAAGDFDGDGIDEIAGAYSGRAISLFSADKKSQICSITNRRTTFLIASDLDSDTQDELIVGDYIAGEITRYDIVNSEQESNCSVEKQSYKDSFIEKDVSDGSIVIKEPFHSVGVYDPSSVGWVSTNGENELAVFFIPRANGGLGGSRVLTMADDGNYGVSNEISSNWHGNRYAAVADSDSDGIGEIYIPTRTLADGDSVAALDMSDYSQIWSLSGEQYSDVGVIQAFDINNDGYLDVLYADRSTLKMVDIESQALLASYKVDNDINDFTLLRRDSSYAVVSAHRNVSLLKVSSSEVSEVDSIEVTCDRIETLNFDNDSEMEIACLHSLYERALTIFEVENEKLVEKTRLVFNYQVLDLIPDPSTSTNQSLILAVRDEDSSSGSGTMAQYKLRHIGNDGFTNWSSPALVGEPTSRGLKARIKDGQLEILLSTSSMMYWFK